MADGSDARLQTAKRSLQTPRTPHALKTGPAQGIDVIQTEVQIQEQPNFITNSCPLIVCERLAPPQWLSESLHTQM